MRDRIPGITQGLLLVVFVPTLVGCATPRHTNTLIFATETKVALDVSQAPAGGFDVTIGFKRKEGVWMPLLANEADAKGKFVPAKCANDDCKTFVGTSEGENPDLADTYSVLATFGGRGSGNASGGSGSGGGEVAVAQYFATGLAARLLAQSGGAALVNTAGEIPNSQKLLSSDAIPEVEAAIDEVINHVAEKDDSTAVDPNKLRALAEKADLSPAKQTALRNFDSTSRLRSFLKANPERYAIPLEDAID